MQLKKALDDFEKITCALILMLIVVIMITNIVLAQFFQTALPWATEVILTSFAFFVWFGISYAMKERKHIQITIVTDALSESGQALAAVIVGAITLLFFVAVLAFGIQWLFHPAVVGQTSLLLQYPMWVLYLSAPAGAALTIVRIVHNMREDITSLRDLRKAV